MSGAAELFGFEGGEHLQLAADDFAGERVVGEGGALLLAGGEDPVEEVGYCGFGGGVGDVLGDEQPGEAGDGIGVFAWGVGE